MSYSVQKAIACVLENVELKGKAKGISLKG